MPVLDLPRAARLCLSICSVKGRKGAKEVKFFSSTIRNEAGRTDVLKNILNIYTVLIDKSSTVSSFISFKSEFAISY